MKSYKVLNKQVFNLGVFSIVPIRFKDRLKILKWRNEQIYHLRQNKIITETDQDFYFKNVVNKLFDKEKPDQILFSYLKNEVCIGYGGLVHINWVDKNAEISFVMDTQIECNGFRLNWSNFLILLEKVAFEDLFLHKIFTYAFNLRPQLYQVLEESGYINEAVLKEHCFHDNKFIDVFIHSKKNLFSLEKVNKNDANLLFNWVNDTQVRLNSLNKNVITWDEHIDWFEKKLKSSDNKMFLLKKKNTFLGQIRIDKKNDNVWIIDYSIDIKFRSKGYGYLIVNALIKRFLGFKFLAVVEKSNSASKKVFEKLNFNKEYEKENNLINYYN